MPTAVRLALLLVFLLTSTAVAAPVQRASMADIESQVMCVTCGIPLELAVSPQADAERATIQQLIDDGRTTAQIKDALVAQLGPSVLALPPRKGFDLAVYIVPIVVIVILLGMFTVGLRRWRRHPPSDADGADDAPELGSFEATRLQADLARFDAR